MFDVSLMLTYIFTVEEFLKQRLRDEHEKRQREEDQMITSIPETEEVSSGITSSAVPAEPTHERKVSSSSRPSSRQSIKRKQTKSLIQAWNCVTNTNYEIYSIYCLCYLSSVISFKLTFYCQIFFLIKYIID